MRIIKYQTIGGGEVKSANPSGIIRKVTSFDLKTLTLYTVAKKPHYPYLSIHIIR